MKKLIEQFCDLAFRREGWISWPPGPMTHRVFDRIRCTTDVESFADAVLKTNPWRPRVHGNGFIQVDLTPTTRLHVWGHPDIPRQEIPTPIHDHMFSFTSRILLGSLMNIAYTSSVQADGGYEVHKAQVRFKEDTTLQLTGQRVNLFEINRMTFYPKDRYVMEPGEIHQSIATELAVTIIEKKGTTLSQGGSSPRVFVPVGLKPDNTFDRYQLPEIDLWRIIAETMRGAR